MRFLFIVFAIAIMCLAAPISSQAQSGIISGPNGTAQCYVLIDSLPATYACNHRASVACVVGGSGYVGGTASLQPLQYPLAIQLRQLPTYAPAGILTIPRLPTVVGAPLTVWLNGASEYWLLSAPFSGQQCGSVTARKP